MKNKNGFLLIKKIIFLCFYLMIVISVLSCSKISSYFSQKRLANTTWQDDDNIVNLSFGDPSFNLNFKNLAGGITTRTGVFSVEGDSIFFIDSKGKNNTMGTIIGDTLTIEIGHSKYKLNKSK